MSGDIFDHQEFGGGGRPVLLAALGNWWVEGRDAANTGQPLTTKNSRAPNINSAKVEKPWV